MAAIKKILRVVVPVAGAVGGYAYTNDNWGFREALSKSAAFTERASFDEHFPRGTWDDNWDFRAPSHLVDPKKYNVVSEEEKKKMLQENTATATRNIILIRHGQYQLQTESKFLTDLGREQALKVGERLAASGIQFDNLVMSTMNRATETANLILTKMPADLKKSSCSLLEEGPPYPPIPDTPHYRPSHSEFFSEGARIESAFRRHIHRASPRQTQDSYEIIVCHANVIRYFICRALQFPPEGWLRISLGNCSLTWLVVRPNGRVSLKMMGDIGHFDKDTATYT